MRKDPMQNTATYSETAGHSSAAAALAPDTKPLNPKPDTVAQLAYRLWEGRGRPEGSPEHDWFRAEELLRTGMPVTAS
jgi:hypothetical protein